MYKINKLPMTETSAIKTSQQVQQYGHSLFKTIAVQF